MDGGADFNNDGYDDFLVSAYYATYVLESDGVVYCMYGGPREADFYFLNDSVCINDIDPLPIIQGLTGGTFSSSPGLVFINSATGEIDLSASTLGTYAVAYSYDGFCLVQRTKYITLGGPLNADFYYAEDTISIGDPNPIPIFTTGVAGSFSSIPEGLVFTDITTGEINTFSSLPGSYSVTNTASNGECSISFQTNITIVNPCTAPSVINVGIATSTSVTITWEDVDSADDYEIYFASSTDTIHFSQYSDTTIYFSGLIIGVDYACWIISNCMFSSSTTSDTLTFNTLDLNVNQLLSNPDIFLFPNPVDDKLIINIDAMFLNPENLRINIINIQGQHIPTSYVRMDDNNYVIETVNLPSGAYILQVKHNSFFSTKNFFLAH